MTKSPCFRFFLNIEAVLETRASARNHANTKPGRFRQIVFAGQKFLDLFRCRGRDVNSTVGAATADIIFMISYQKFGLATRANPYININFNLFAANLQGSKLARKVTVDRPISSKTFTTPAAADPTHTNHLRAESVW